MAGHNRNIHSFRCADRVLAAAVSGRVNVKEFITKKIPFAQVQKGFEELNAMGGTPGKAMLIMD